MSGAPADPILPLDIHPPLIDQLPTTVRKRPHHWTSEEDARLLAAIKSHGTENWRAVAAAVGGRSRSQCAQRWHRCLNTSLAKRNWSREEEQQLIEAVRGFGGKAWTRVAATLKNRSDVQCRWRYNFLAKKAAEAGTEIQPVSPLTAAQVGAEEADASN
jgi:hypothetical protein